jgi:hypothetical protein
MSDNLNGTVGAVVDVVLDGEADTVVELSEVPDPRTEPGVEQAVTRDAKSATAVTAP